MAVCETRQEEIRRTALLRDLEKRLRSGRRPLLRPSEAMRILDWAVSCDRPETQREILTLFRGLGGLEMVRAALSDFD